MKAKVVTLLNLSDDHLDRHQTIAQYGQIKQKIYQQSEVALYNRQDDYSKPVRAVSNSYSFGVDAPEEGQYGILEEKGELWLSKGQQRLASVSTLPLAGIHNASNCLVALAMGELVGWPMDKMLTAVSSFTGLPHRCQRIDSNDGISWINDSKATNVGATIAAIEGLATELINNKKLVLIAGGESKGADLSPLATPFEQVHTLITLGRDGDKLAALHQNSIRTSTMAEAVEEARKVACAGDVVLLSPACASLDMFTNFAARGDSFKHHVLQVNETPVQREAM